jgi:general secretion pathway protein B
MSLILEALKKSERQRRLGESPSIGSPIMAVRRRRSFLPALIGLIAVALVVLWWLRREPSAEPSANRVAEVATAPAASAPQAPVAHNAATFDGRPVETAAKPEPAQSSAASRMPRSKVPADATSGLPADLRERVRSGDVVVANPKLLKPGQPATIAESGVAPAAAGAERVPAEEPVAAPVQARESAAVPLPAAKPSPPAGTVKPAPSAPAAVQPAPIVNSVPMIWELPLAVRRDLPELSITMHVFAIAPENRFVILNGERHVEGDDVGGMTLVEIRADGVLFEREGQRFLLPRGGH